MTRRRRRRQRRKRRRSKSNQLATASRGRLLALARSKSIQDDGSVLVLGRAGRTGSGGRGSRIRPTPRNWKRAGCPRGTDEDDDDDDEEGEDEEGGPWLVRRRGRTRRTLTVLLTVSGAGAFVVSVGGRSRFLGSCARRFLGSRVRVPGFVSSVSLGRSPSPAGPPPLSSSLLLPTSC